MRKDVGSEVDDLLKQLISREQNPIARASVDVTATAKVCRVILTSQTIENIIDI